MRKPQIRAMWAKKVARGFQTPNPRTAPLGVILVSGLPTAQAIRVVGDLDTPSVIEQALSAERRCLARSAVIDALKARLAVRRMAEKNNAEAQRRRGRKA